MPLLDIQRRGQQIGRIRIGEKVLTGKKNTNGDPISRPSRLDTFRLTTGSRLAAEAVAALLGGEVKPWENRQFEVITERSEIAVVVPPRDQVISQHYEMWSKGGCQRRCDSVTEKLSGKPCLCPQPEDSTDPDDVARASTERAELAKKNPPEGCKAVTRLNVMIPDLPGLGVWRLDTGSFYAAVEMGDSAELLEMARDHEVFLPAVLRIDQRTRVANGQTKKYPVPVLEVTATFRQIATGELLSGGMRAQLPPAASPARQAITTGAKAIEQAPQKPAAAVKAGPPPSAQELADRAAKATTRQQINAIKAEADEHLVASDMVNTSFDTDLQVFEELDAYLKARWKELPDATEQQDEVA